MDRRFVGRSVAFDAPKSAVLLCIGAALTLVFTALGSPHVAAGSDSGASPGAYRILLSSDRDGKTRTYSVDQEGSRLSPLFPPGRPRPLEPVAVSRDGSTIVYSANAERLAAIYVSRADGTGLRRLVQKGLNPVFSPDGRLLAVTTRTGIWIVGTNGHGFRRLTSGEDDAPDWSPDGKVLVFMRVIGAKNRYGGGRYGVVVKPLRGKGRVLVRTGQNDDPLPGEYQPRWSPNGRWIAYLNLENAERRNGLTVVRPNGKRRHRVVIGVEPEETFEWSSDGRWLASEHGRELDYILPSGKWHRISSHLAGSVVWSPDGKMLAFPVYVGGGDDVAVARADGRGVRRLHLGLGAVWTPAGLMWLPDARRIAFAGNDSGDPRQIWVVGSDGRGLRRLTNEGTNDVVGWTRLAPALPPASPLPPTERVLGADTVATSTPIAALSADGPRVAFAPRATVTDCLHVVVWTPGDDLARLGNLPTPCSRFWGGAVRALALAGSRAAWVSYGGDSDTCWFTLKSATLADPAARGVSGEHDGSGALCKSPDIDHLRGDGDLLVFNDEPSHASWLVRIGVGGEKCRESLCTTLRKDAQAAPVDSVSGGLIAIRKRAAVTVLDAQGRLVRNFPFAPADVYAARLDGGRLLVARSYTIASYDVGTGAAGVSRPLPAGYKLVDADDGIAVLSRAATVILLRLADGASLTLTPGQGPVLAELEPPGLYYSYVAGDGGGRLVFLPRAELLRQLGGGS